MIPGGVCRGHRGRVLVPRRPGELSCGVDLDIGRGDPPLRHLRNTQPRPPRSDRIERIPDDVHRNAEVDQRAEHHVAGGPARAVDVQMPPPHAHARTASRAILTAAIAAPTPLSMFTTVIPGAHALSIEASATSPSIDTP